MYRNLEPTNNEILMGCMAGIFPNDRTTDIKFPTPIMLGSPLTSNYNFHLICNSRCNNVVTRHKCILLINNSNIMGHVLKYINGTLTIRPVERCKFLKGTNGFPKYVREIDLRLPFYNI